MRNWLGSGCMFLAFALSASCSDSDSSAGGQPGGGGTAGRGGVGAISGSAAGGRASGGDAAGQEPRGGAGSSTGGAEGGGDPAGGGGEGGEGGEPEAPPVDCGPLVAAPAKFETFGGFTSTEDFVFDDQGNYVGVDDDSNLVRITKAGKKTLWAPGMGSTAGMAMMPDGSVVIADVGNGAVKRVYPNGASQVVLGGLLYPNGLDIGPDGFIYVAENNAGRVRRVDPETGAYTIVAMGLFGPNGVAFGRDAKVMYVGSFEGAGVYRVDLPQPGALGTAKVFAAPPGVKLPEPTLACPDGQVGKACTTFRSSAGTCEKLSNVVDCVATQSECSGKPNETACKDEWGSSGQCVEGYCEAIDSCTTLQDGAVCQLFGEEGTCAGGACMPADPCAGKKAGDACMFGGLSGTCQEELGALACELQLCGDPKQCPTEQGGIDGLGVDACGYVYASQYVTGIVWRISPSGEIEELVTLPSAWVPNIKWGRGFGGFERDVMYVADRNDLRLFGVAVGRPGAPEYYDLGKP